ncbi:MAG: ABC transporter ATP-binding protein [Desulfobacteraceae bacterium]|nr:ABC transporter ATP-binding protein [Desulfobacteraceae bacterium]
MTHILDIKDLVTNFYTYEGVVKALNKVSFHVNHGSTFGLVGESGCGKSVTVRSIMQIVQSPGVIEGGEIHFSPDSDNGETGIDLLKQTERFMQDLRGNKISMIFQEPNAALNPIMTIGEQIAESYVFHRKNQIIEKILGLDRTGENLFPKVSANPLFLPLYHLALHRPDAFLLELIKKVPFLRNWDRAVLHTAIEKSVELLATLGIPNPDKIVHQYPHNLSGGMKQRVVIAIALASEPVLLIADEATSNLDVTVQAQILDLLKDLKKKNIISSILLITHDLGVVNETCDRVGVMYAGNLCEVGKVTDLFENPKHPYTKALLDSVPKIRQIGDLKSIAGNVPNLVNPPLGCRFHPRCGHAMAKCKEVFPEMTIVDDDHEVACYLYH